VFARSISAILIVLTSVVCLSSVARAACELRPGQRVVLASVAPDPDVFIWDSRARLIDYAAGMFGDAKAVISHTTLAKPGTRAIVARCETGVVHPQYVASTFDAIGIRVTTGPYRGRYGWVVSEDVHPAR
jgi:hypothetical protein